MSCTDFDDKSEVVFLLFTQYPCMKSLMTRSRLHYAVDPSPILSPSAYLVLISNERFSFRITLSHGRGSTDVQKCPTHQNYMCSAEFEN